MRTVDYLSKDYDRLLEQVFLMNAKGTDSIVVINGGKSDLQTVLSDIELAAKTSMHQVREHNLSTTFLAEFFTERKRRRDADNSKSGKNSGRESDDILLFDEADALFGQRTDVHDAHDRYANIEVSHLIERLEQHRGVVVFTTTQAIDKHSSLLTKADTVICFPKIKTALRRWRSKLIAFFR